MKTKIAIIYGGPGSEHEVSVWSANNVFDNIDSKLFEVIKIFCDKNLNFFINENKEGQSLDQVCDYLLDQKIHKVSPVLHGEFGEGGQLQKKLEDKNIKYVGSDSRVSNLAMNKNSSNILFSSNGINIPKSKIINIDNIIEQVLDLNFPIILKPINEGSSMGLFKILNLEDLNSNLEIIFKNNNEMLMQEFVSGREFTCAVVDMGEAGEIALTPTEIILTSTETFDYNSKYTPNKCNEIVMPNLDSKVLTQIKDVALRCHKLIGCKDLSRTDIILTPDNKLFVLEINTIPGMTKNSFLPKQLVASGYNFKDFLTQVLIK